MNASIIYGSPDKSGSSFTLGQSLVNGLKSGDAQVEEINIYDYKITEVWKDYFGHALQNDFSQAGDDDMAELKDKMRAADLIVVVSPIYWYQLSGKMKTFVDRWTDLINPDFTSELSGKGMALVSTHSGLNIMNSSNYLQLAMEATARFLGMVWMGGVDAPIKMPISAGPSASNFILAEEFGEKLARGENYLGMKVL